MANLPPWGDAVGDVGEKVPTLELDKVSEDGSLEKLTVKLGDTIDLERADNSEESHPDVFRRAFLDDRHSLDTIHVVRPSLGDLSEEVVVDPVDDLKVSRQELFEQADFPLLESFRQDSVAAWIRTVSLFGVG